MPARSDNPTHSFVDASAKKERARNVSSAHSLTHSLSFAARGAGGVSLMPPTLLILLFAVAAAAAAAAVVIPSRSQVQLPILFLK